MSSAVNLCRVLGWGCAAGSSAAQCTTHPVLMQDRDVSSAAEWRRQIAGVDAQILAYLRKEVSGGFDEAAFGDRMGFASLKRWVTAPEWL